MKKPEVLFTLDQVNAAIDTAKWGKVYSLMSHRFTSGKETCCLLATSKVRFL